MIKILIEPAKQIGAFFSDHHHAAGADNFSVHLHIVNRIEFYMPLRDDGKTEIMQVCPVGIDHVPMFLIKNHRCCHACAII